jgi:xanthine/uracil permease
LDKPDLIFTKLAVVSLEGAAAFLEPTCVEKLTSFFCDSFLVYVSSAGYFMGDGLATMVSGAVGGTGMTTYAENIGVMTATKVYSTAIFLVAAAVAILMGFSPKFGALIQAVPLPVMGGISIVVFGLIAVAGAKIWVDNKVDFTDNKNLIVAAVTLVLGTGDFTLKFGQFSLGGIGTATFGAILLYALLNRSK